MGKQIKGFSKFTKEEKIDWVIEKYFADDQKEARKTLEQYWNDKKDLQKIHDEFIENTLTNYYLPFGIAPNFKINNRIYALPMAIEESSVVAAAAKAGIFLV